MEITIVPIDSIKLNPKNPRVIRDRKFKLLVKSIQNFPKMLKLRPIVVNDEMVTLGGNMRLKASIEAGLKEVPIIKASELTDKEQEEFIIKDNSSFGEWDWEILANGWDELDLKDWGIDVPTFETNDEDIQLNMPSDESFRVTITCNSEEEQNEIYKKLVELGFNVNKI